LPLTSAKTSFCQWQKLVFAGKNYFCRDGFFRGKNRFLPVTGKNLPTLITTLIPLISASFEAVQGGGCNVNCYLEISRKQQSREWTAVVLSLSTEYFIQDFRLKPKKLPPTGGHAK